LKIELSTITADLNGWQQSITLENTGRKTAPKTRREVFVGRDISELTRYVDERIADLKRLKV
jgi:hypothetical protein